MAYQASVDEAAQVEVMVAQILADLGRVDILVCNAGTASRGQSLVDTDPAELAGLFGTHVLGTAHLCRLLVPRIRQQERGDVVVISSIATRRASANGGPYMMTKAALEAFAQTLALEELQHGIHVNIVAPGLVATDMGDRLVRAVAGLDSAVALDDRSPFGHVCRPEEVADVVAFLCSAQAGYVSGQKIYVDGGGSSF